MPATTRPTWRLRHPAAATTQSMDPREKGQAVDAVQVTLGAALLLLGSLAAVLFAVILLLLEAKVILHLGGQLHQKRTLRTSACRTATGDQPPTSPRTGTRGGKARRCRTLRRPGSGWPPRAAMFVDPVPAKLAVRGAADHQAPSPAARLRRLRSPVDAAAYLRARRGAGPPPAAGPAPAGPAVEGAGAAPAVDGKESATPQQTLRQEPLQGPSRGMMQMTDLWPERWHKKLLQRWQRLCRGRPPGGPE